MRPNRFSQPIPDLFPTTREFAFVAEDDGRDGISDPLRAAILNKRSMMQTKLTSGGCKTMESVADAVGFIRALDFTLGWAEAERHDRVKSDGEGIHGQGSLET